MTDKLSGDEVKAMGSRAAEIFGQLTTIMKDENQSVIGAVLGSLLAGFIAAHDLDEQMEALRQVLILAKGIVHDLNAANGVDDTVEFQFVYEDGVREEMEKDPKMAEFVRDQTARVRQALSDYHAGKYKSMDDAMQAAGLSQVDADDLEEMKDRLGSGRKPS